MGMYGYQGVFREAGNPTPTADGSGPIYMVGFGSHMSRGDGLPTTMEGGFSCHLMDGCGSLEPFGHHRG